MKVLITSCPNYGHLFPMVPLAWALRASGHEVLAAVPQMMTRVAASAGLPTVSIGSAVIQADHSAQPVSQDEGAGALAEHVEEFYVPLAEQTIDATLDVARRWGADAVLHPSWEYAGPLAAAVLDIPSVFHAWGLVPPAEVDQVAQQALAGLYRRYGLGDTLPPERFWIDVCPPGLCADQQRSDGVPMTYLPYNGSGVLPDWLGEPRSLPRVCVTLGNIPILGDHDTVLSQVLAGLAGLDVEVVLAAAARLAIPDHLPPTVRVARELPLSALVPACDVVVHHGGAGSAMTTLANGLPALVLPQMCVQFQHAHQIAAAGAGEYLSPGKATADAIGDAVRRLLGDSPAARRAGALRDELAARPQPAAVAAVLAAGLAGDAG